MTPENRDPGTMHTGQHGSGTPQIGKDPLAELLLGEGCRRKDRQEEISEDTNTFA